MKETTRGPDAPAVARDLEPLIAPRDTPALSPPPTLSVPIPPTPPPQDFATLVDRLVAAREAAQPLAVHAALAHAEFGRIALRLAPDGDGLSVGLANPDPGFAPAVQAAAASQAANSGDDRGASPARPESTSQQASGGAPDGRGGQPQSRGSTPDLPTPPRPLPAAPPGADRVRRSQAAPEQSRERPGGIYA